MRDIQLRPGWPRKHPPANKEGGALGRRQGVQRPWGRKREQGGRWRVMGTRRTTRWGKRCVLFWKPLGALREWHDEGGIVG